MQWLLKSGQRIHRTWRSTLPAIVIALVTLTLLADRFGISIHVPSAIASPLIAADALELSNELAGSSDEVSDDVDTEEQNNDQSPPKDPREKTKGKAVLKNSTDQAKVGADEFDHGEENEEPKLDDEKKTKKKKKKKPVDPPKVESSGDSLDQKLERIRNPESDEEAFEYVAVETKRKLLKEAAAEARRTGKKVDFLSNRRFSPAMEKSYARLERTIERGIRNGSMTEREGLQTLQQARLAGRLFTAGGEFLNGKVPDRWNPGRPDVRTGIGPTTKGFQLNKAQRQMSKLYDNMNTLLTSSRATPTLTNGVTRLDVARQQSLFALDPTAIAQGPMGTCWTCTAETMGWFWAPDQMSAANNQLIFNQRFVSPFGGKGRSYSVADLMPTDSNRNYDMNRAGSGEQSYVNMLDQVLIGNIAGNSAPQNGGDPAAASGALYSVTGVSGTPTQYGVGGIPGLIRGINEGTLRTVQYIPFPGHSASNSGRLLPTTDGGYLGFGINDNSWGQSNERMFLATQENADKFKFPGGMGSNFGMGGMTGAVSGVMAGLLGSMQGQPVSEADKQAAEKATTQQQDEEYNKLDTYSRVLVRSVCVQAVTPSTTSLPQVCRRALTDQSLPKLISSWNSAPDQTASDSVTRF